jgi:hypothetical protein
MNSLDGATIEIIKWEKYNPRKDLKATNWLRLQNSLFEDPNFIEFNHSEILFWVYLLSMASKKQAGSIRLSVAHAERIGRFRTEDITSAIAKLTELECVQVTEREVKTGVTSTSRTRNTDVRGHNLSGNTTNERTNNQRDERNETNGAHVHAPDSSNPDATKENLPIKEVNPEGPTPTALTWRSYRDAYQEKYGEAPPFNAKIGGQLKSFVSRVPKEEAPSIAAFFLTHKDQYYLKSMHPVGLLLRDAEKLRTEWATGRQMTGAQARQSEQRDANVEAMKAYLANKGAVQQ